VSRTGWMTLAACRGESCEVFFPENHRDASPAKAVCARCPVTDACLEYALADPTTVGIWAGTTVADRVRIRRARRRAGSAT
jgi:WhiB family transcriptional regulator, redox-sensing transcriptional regulator